MPPPFDMTYTIFFCEEDKDTIDLLNESHPFPRQVCLNLWTLPKTRLMRRAIGRNLAAKATTADWIWFTDADVVFGSGALDSLPRVLENLKGPLAYPERIIKTSFEVGDYLIKQRQRIHEFPEHYFTDPEVLKRAIGPCQIVRGSVAVDLGYCENTDFQQEEIEWKRTFEDVRFREILGLDGAPISLPNVYLFRHTLRGRYTVGAKL